MLEMLIGPISGLLDKFIPDADEKARLAHEISTMATRHAHELAKEQISINREEAKHSSIFVADGVQRQVGYASVAWHLILSAFLSGILLVLWLA